MVMTVTTELLLPVSSWPLIVIFFLLVIVVLKVHNLLTLSSDTRGPRWWPSIELITVENYKFLFFIFYIEAFADLRWLNSVKVSLCYLREFSTFVCLDL